MSAERAFIFAALWACIAVWGFFLSNPGFSIGGIAMAVAFAGWGIAQKRSRRKP